YFSGGAVVYDFKGEKSGSFLPEKSVTEILIDHEGGYWFSTLNSGVYYAKNINIKTYDNSYIESISSIKGGIVLSTFNGDITIYKNGQYIYKNPEIRGTGTTSYDET